MSDFLAVLKELTYLYDPEELDNLPLPREHLAKLNEWLGEIFKVLPPDHHLWQVVKRLKSQDDLHKVDIKRCADALQDVGLALYGGDPKYVVYVEDYPCLAEAFHNYTAKHGATDLKTSFQKFKAA